MSGDTTIDAFLGGLFQLEQPRKGPRAGIDAMLLAATVPVAADREETVLDAGSGSGAIALSIAARFPLARVTAVERQSAMAALARRNAERNGLAQRLQVVEGDLTQPLQDLAALGLARHGFAHVVANPPYYDQHRSRPSPSADRSAAHRLAPDDLAAWLGFLTNMAAGKATLSLIHVPERLPELLALIGRRFGALKVAPVFARMGEPAIRVVIQGVKGSRAPLQLLPGLVLQDADGRYGPEADAILRHGAPWRL
jgi:tRNA1(Val) A37 N6-methylase TrmN6